MTTNNKKRYHVVTEEEAERVRKAYKDGDKWREVAANCGILQTNASRIIKGDYTGKATTSPGTRKC